MAEPRDLLAKAELEKHFGTVEIRKAAGQWMYSLDPQGDRDAVASILSAHLHTAFDGQDAHMLVFSPDNKILLPMDMAETKDAVALLQDAGKNKQLAEKLAAARKPPQTAFSEAYQPPEADVLRYLEKISGHVKWEAVEKSGQKVYATQTGLTHPDDAKRVIATRLHRKEGVLVAQGKLYIQASAITHANFHGLRECNAGEFQSEFTPLPSSGQRRGEIR
jgi:hypothetical protein